ncbi:MAG: alpha-amylase family glycosyl hydrolase, partial [Faecousia sp.]
MKQKQRFVDRSVLRRVLSFALALVMLLSLASGLPGTLTAKAADSLSLRVNDLVQVKVGDTLTTMNLYKGGTYEAPVAVSAGSTTAVLVVNGLETDLTVTLTASEDCTIPVRYRNGSLSTIETRKTAALAGSFSNDGTNVRFLADDGSTFSLGWTPEDPNGELNYLGGGIFARTFQISDLSSDTYVEFKITFDDSWSDALGYYGNNMSCTIPAGTTTFTLLVDALNFTCYDSINSQNFTVPQNGGKPNVSKPALTTAISLIGTARCSDTDNWNASATGYEFAQYTDTLFCYQATLDASDTPYMYKCVFDYSTWYEAESDNRTISLTEQTRVVFVYDTSTGLLYDSVNNPAKVAELLNTQAPPAKMQVIDNVNGTTTFVAAADDGKSVTLYYCDRATPDEVTSVWLGYSNGGTASSGNLFLGDDALDILYWYEIDGVRTLDGSNPIVIVGSTDYSHYTREAFTGRTITVPGSFPGPSWDETSNVMTYEGNGRYTYTFLDVPVASYQYKIAAGTWDENYGANGAFDGANITVSVPAAQDVTIYYNDFSHRSVCSVDYIVADVTLTGTGIPAGTKLADEYLTGIYAVTVPMSAGTYTDLRITCGGKTYAFASVEVAEAKDVTFYLDPVTGIYYCNASDIPLDTEHIYFDSKNSEYKSVFGAVATGESVTFAIDTGVDAISVTLVVKGMNACSLPMEKQGAAVNGVQKWAVTTSFANLSENSYYFAISNGSTVKIYGDDDGCYGTGTVTDLSNVWAYDLVVYQSGFETPDWMKNAVVYQIFPDRFFDGAECNNFAQLSARGEVDYEYITDWYALPENPEQEGLLSEDAYKATGAFYGDREWANEMYGGDFKGIVERIDYLKALGVNVIYLNPVFSSISNHRYDACDYTKIDPLLGTMGSFEELVKIAEENDMHIILDGVFNHVSDDSIYFDRYYKFLGTSEKIGAYPYWAYVYDYMADTGADQATAEAAAKQHFTANYGITDYAYTEWFAVENQPLIEMDTGEEAVDNIGLRKGKTVYGYEGWWGYDSMPVIKSTNGSEYQTGNWAKEIIYNEDGTSVTQFWLSQGSNGWRLDVADEVSAETWREFRKSVKALDSDAVIVGEIWTDATGYLLGDMYDSVMNYMFRGAVTSFAMGGTAADSTKTLERLRERYPEEALYAMMNLVGSHDTTRILSYLDGIPDNRDDKSVDATFPTYEKTSELAKQRQYLTAFLQFTYAGAPTIYYGDEIGMVGADDPDDRRCFTWGKGNEELVTWYAKLAAIRAQYPALRTGSVEPFTVNDNTMGYVRRDANDTIIVLASNSQSAQQITLKPADFGISASALTDAVSGTAYTVAANGTIAVTIPALRGVILTENVKSVTVDKENLKPAYDPAYIVEARDAEPTLTHNEITVAVTPATCTEPGQNKIICADCGTVINAQEVVPATGHSYTYIDNGDGTHTKTCDLCGDTATEAHTFVDGSCDCGAEEAPAIPTDANLKFISDALSLQSNINFQLTSYIKGLGYERYYVEVVRTDAASGEVSSTLESIQAGTNY